MVGKTTVFDHQPGMDSVSKELSNVLELNLGEMLESPDFERLFQAAHELIDQVEKVDIIYAWIRFADYAEAYRMFESSNFQSAVEKFRATTEYYGKASEEPKYLINLNSIMDRLTEHRLRFDLTKEGERHMRCDDQAAQLTKAGVRLVQVSLCLNNKTDIDTIENACVALNKILRHKTTTQWNKRVDCTGKCDLNSALGTDYFLLGDGRVDDLSNGVPLNRFAQNFAQMCNAELALPQ